MRTLTCVRWHAPLQEARALKLAFYHLSTEGVHLAFYHFSTEGVQLVVFRESRVSSMHFKLQEGSWGSKGVYSCSCKSGVASAS